MNIKQIIIISFVSSVISLSANARENNDIRKLETTLRIGAAKQNLGFITPAANSILQWNSDTLDGGLDLKYNFTNNIFTELEYTYSKIKGGSSIDDDITNGGNAYSWHGVDGRANDYKLNFGYKIYNPKPISLYITAGAFYKDVKVSSTDGYLSYSPFISEGLGAQTNSKYYGAMLGFRLQSKTSNTKSFIQADALLPLRYEGDQIWYGRDPDLHWRLRNNKNIHGDYGFRVKGEFGYKVKNSFIQYAKIYTYYERITINGLTETEPTWEVKGGSPGSAVEGQAQYEAYGAGLALEF